MTISTSESHQYIIYLCFYTPSDAEQAGLILARTVFRDRELIFVPHRRVILERSFLERALERMDLIRKERVERESVEKEREERKRAEKERERAEKEGKEATQFESARKRKHAELKNDDFNSQMIPQLSLVGSLIG